MVSAGGEEKKDQKDATGEDKRGASVLHNALV